MTAAEFDKLVRAKTPLVAFCNRCNCEAPRGVCPQCGPCEYRLVVEMKVKEVETQRELL